MTPIRILTTAFFSLVLFTSCHPGNSIIISNGDDNLNISYNGDIKFNDDETAIKSISPGGYLKYTRNNKKVIAENNAQGSVSYELFDDGRKVNPADPEGKQILIDAIKNMIDVGFDAKARLERFYKKGGVRAVLNETDNLKSDYLKAMYLEYLFSADSITNGEMREVVRKIGTQMGSDYDKGRLLGKFPVDYLRDSATGRAWFDAVKGVGGDYEKSNALIYLAREPISKEQLNRIVDVANTINSDYDKANVLKELIFKRTFAEENFDRTLDAVSYINSDYEKANLLKALIEKEKPSADHYNKLLDVVVHVSSDYDRSNLLKELVEIGLPVGAGFDKLVSAVVHTGSEFDKANLLKDITNKNLTTPDQWISIINAAAEVSSDVDKSNLLITIAPNMPKSDSVKMAYLKVAKTINGETELGRAVRAVE